MCYSSVKFIVTFGVSLFIFCCTVFADCYQEISAQVNSGSLPSIAEPESREAGMQAYQIELEQCTGLSGISLYVDLLRNYCALKTGKQGDSIERIYTLLLLSNYDLSNLDYLKKLVLERYSASEEQQEVLFSMLLANDSRGHGPFEIDFSPYQNLLIAEDNSDTIVSLALLDYMFARSPGLALLIQNSEVIEDVLLDQVKLLSYIHFSYLPEMWPEEDMHNAEINLETILNSNYNNKEIFIAEIVTTIPELRSETMNTFLEESNHPLVVKRL